MGAQRQRQELTEAFARHRGFVRERMRTLGVAASDVDDATQDVFVVMARRLADFEGGRPMRHWAAGIARRVARRYRGAPGRQVMPLEEIEEVRDASAVDPEEHAARSEAFTVLQHFLDGLDEDRWQVFVLAELEGLRGTEIAAELGVNLNTVYARLRSAHRDFDRAVRRHRARARRGLWGWLPLGWQDRPARLAVPALGLVALAAVLGTQADRGCAGDDKERSIAVVEDPAADKQTEAPRSAKRRGVFPFVEVRAPRIEPPSDASAESADETTEWYNAGSGHSAGATWAATRNARYRIVDGRYVELELEFIMEPSAAEEARKLQEKVVAESADPRLEVAKDLGGPMPRTEAHFVRDGLEVVEGPEQWTMALEPGEKKRIETTFEATRDGLVQTALHTQGCDTSGYSGGSTTYIKLVKEDGTLRRCTKDDDVCTRTPFDLELHDELHRDEEDAGDDKLPAERVRFEISNDCPETVRFVAGPKSVRPDEADPVHEIAPGQHQVLELHPEDRVGKLEEDGNVRLSVWSSGEDVAMKFVGPGCNVSATDAGG